MDINREMQRKLALARVNMRGTAGLSLLLALGLTVSALA